MRDHSTLQLDAT